MTEASWTTEWPGSRGHLVLDDGLKQGGREPSKFSEIKGKFGGKYQGKRIRMHLEMRSDVINKESR